MEREPLLDEELLVEQPAEFGLGEDLLRVLFGARFAGERTEQASLLHDLEPDFEFRDAELGVFGVLVFQPDGVGQPGLEPTEEPGGELRVFVAGVFESFREGREMLADEREGFFVGDVEPGLTDEAGRAGPISAPVPPLPIITLGIATERVGARSASRHRAGPGPALPAGTIGVGPSFDQPSGDRPEGLAG